MTPHALEMLLHLSLNESFDLPAEVQDELISAELVGYVPKDSRWFINSRGQDHIARVIDAPRALTAEAKVYRSEFIAAMEGRREATVALPDGFTPVSSVAARGLLPPGLSHDSHVTVIHRDGKINKPARVGMRLSLGEAALFNWKHYEPGGPGTPDDDIIGYMQVAPPENKMSLKQAAGA